MRLALSFLTVVPVRFPDGDVSEAEIAGSRRAYPVVGALIGVVLGVWSGTLAGGEVSPGLASFLILLAWAAITGGLHLDGLADTADGLFLRGGPGRRLTVMRDPHVGSFGVAALVLVVLGKYAALTSLVDSARSEGVFLAAVVGRSLVLVSAGTANYARPEGTGRIFVEATTVRDAVIGGLVALIAGGLTAGEAGLFASGAGVILALGLTRLAHRRIGGVTGDTLGALVETSECLVLTVLGLAGGHAARA